MAITSPDLSVPIRNALINSTVVADIPEYLDSQAIFTLTPIPEDTPFPCIVISFDVSKRDPGTGLHNVYLRIVRQITVIGLHKSIPDQVRIVEATSYAIFDLFHRKPRALTVPGWNVWNIWVDGPIQLPQDDSKFEGRIVTLNIDLVTSADI